MELAVWKQVWFLLLFLYRQLLLCDANECEVAMDCTRLPLDLPYFAGCAATSESEAKKGECDEV